MRILLSILALLPIITAQAQGPRSSGMGGAGLTLRDEWSGLGNQAMLAYITDPATGAGYYNRFLLNELATSQLIVAIPTKAGVFGTSVRYFGFELYNETSAGISYSRKFGEKFAAGMQIDYLRTFIGEGYGSRSAFSVQAGFYTQITEELSFGAHLANPNRALLTKDPEEPYPSTIATGLGYTFSEKVFAAAELYLQSGNELSFRGGLDYKIHPSVWLRAGMASKPVESTFGTSLVFRNLRLDIAARWHPVLGVSPHGGLIYAFR